MSPSPMDWAPKAVAGTVPGDAAFSDAPVVAYVSLNDAVFNFGHALFDFLFPVFNTLQLLDVYHPDFQLLLAKHQVSRLAMHCPTCPDCSARGMPCRKHAVICSECFAMTPVSCVELECDASRTNLCQ